MLLSLVALLLILIFFSAFASASETALFSLSSMKVRAFREDKDPRKVQVANLLSSPRDLLITIIIINVAMNILVQNVTSALFGELSGWMLNVGVPLGLTLIFGEIIPKSIGLANNAEISYRVVPILSFIQKFLSPIRKALVAVNNVLSHFLFFFLRREKEISVDELQHALKTSKKEGIIGEDEAELMRGYLRLQEASVKELMRPREEVLFFDLKEPLSKLIHLFVDQECSRIPVCEGGLDNVIGIVASHDFFIRRNEIRDTVDLLPFLHKPFFVPEATDAESLLAQLYGKKESLAIVVDEYGSLSGLIALEDLVETVVGEIVDRRDEKSRYTRSGEDVIIASGKLEVSELETLFDVNLPSQHNMVTIGGWLTEQLGDIPKSGTKFIKENLLFHVLAADTKRVRRIYIRRLKPQVSKRKNPSS